jgi:signal transduction histidine kinase
MTLTVRDDGVGGADTASGTGLTGLADRVAAVGGIMMLSSPHGGPTILRVEIPCPRSADCA